MSTRPRPNPYIWATWLAPLLAGSAECRCAAWFKAHFYYQKLVSFDEPKWQAEHAPLVACSVNDLIGDDFLVAIEDQNKFALRSGDITLAGKPDLVAVKANRTLVVDCKSGAPRPAHRAQVMIYMAILPWVRPDLKGSEIEGLVQYREQEIWIPASAIDAEYFHRLRTTIHVVGGPTPPARVPSMQECGFCSIGHLDCPERIELLEPVLVTAHDLF